MVGGVAYDCGFVVGGAAFEAVRLHGRAGQHSHCEAVASFPMPRDRLYLLAMTSRRSNLLDKGNPAKKGFGIWGSF